MASSAADAATAAATPTSPEEDTIVQYIVVRKDLKWPVGAMITQGAHAAVAAVWASREDPVTQAYVADGAIDRMHKITLEAGSAEALATVSASLSGAGIGHKLWVEQPEGIPSALASKPHYRSALKPHFAGLKLMR